MKNTKYNWIYAFPFLRNPSLKSQFFVWATVGIISFTPLSTSFAAGINSNLPIPELNPVFMGAVSIGSYSVSGDLTLDVEGKVGATEYCDENGNNCYSFPTDPNADRYLKWNDTSSALEWATVTQFSPSTLDADYGAETITSDFDFGGGILQIPNSTTLPATCEVGDVYMDSDATLGKQFYVCTDDDPVTWTLQGAGGKFVDGTNTNDAVYTTGNVGIGTTTPEKLLHLKTATGTNAEINIQSGEENKWGIYQHEDTADLRFWNTGADNLLTLTDEGGVGIGITTPGAKLDVNGSFQVDGGAMYYNDTTGRTSIDQLKIGNLFFEEDAGVISWGDLPVSSTPAAGVVQSYSAQIDGNNALTIYAEADGSGGIQNKRVKIHDVLQAVPTDSPGTCSASYEGAMYYDDSMNEPCFCNGSAWTQFDGGGSCS